MTYDEAVEADPPPSDVITTGTTTTTGLSFNPPPLSVFPQVIQSISDAVKALPSDKTGGIVAIATEKGVNLAIVQRVGNDFTVAGWVGKTWSGQTEYGAELKYTW